jgi:Fe-Mn family superoxide dismutase
MYTLPDLPYAYDALEPYIDEKTMRLHHQKHQQGYVDGLNKALKKLRQARHQNEYDMIRHWERELAFNGSGHINHQIFWHSMCPSHLERRTKVRKPFIELVHRSFGSFQNLRDHFTAAAKSVEGSGWGMMFYEPTHDRLMIQAVENHQDSKLTNGFVVMALDVWEHAYYLQYQNERGRYIENWWNIVDWHKICERTCSRRY